METKIIKDELGEHKEITQDNGIKIKILKNPSKLYLDKIKIRNDIQVEKTIEHNKNMEIRKLIDDQIKQDAIAKLKLSGKLDKDGNLI